MYHKFHLVTRSEVTKKGRTIRESADRQCSESKSLEVDVEFHLVGSFCCSLIDFELLICFLLRLQFCENKREMKQNPKKGQKI